MPKETISCPDCQRKLRVPEEMHGKLVKCPSCGKTFTAAAAPAAPTQLPVEELPPWEQLSQEPAPDPHGSQGKRRFYAPEEPDDYEEEDERRPRRRIRQRGEFHCPFCQTSQPPIVQKKVATAGWMLMAILMAMIVAVSVVGAIFCCFPIFGLLLLPLGLVGMLITENSRVCSGCGIKLD